MDATHEAITVDRIHDGGTVRLSDCHVEHGTLTAHTLEVGDFR